MKLIKTLSQWHNRLLKNKSKVFVYFEKDSCVFGHRKPTLSLTSVTTKFKRLVENMKFVFQRKKMFLPRPLVWTHGVGSFRERDRQGTNLECAVSSHYIH